MNNLYKELHNSKHISDKQFAFLESIRTNKIVSVYYELRMLLYLGILLFTGGVGYFAYQNIGEIGHLLLMGLIALAIGLGFYYIQKFASPYSNQEVKVNHIYFDYILLLVSLLIITLFTYIQVYFDLVELLINYTSFISAALLITMAYLYCNRALLSMAIVAFTAAVGLSITPINWVTGDLGEHPNLHMIGIFLGLFLMIIGQFSLFFGIKKHFRFTYQNFGLILYYIGCVAALDLGDSEYLYAFLLLLSAAAMSYYTWMMKEFLFFLYSNLAFYIALTFLLFSSLSWLDDEMILMELYFPVTCIGYVIFLVNKKSHFSHD